MYLNTAIYSTIIYYIIIYIMVNFLLVNKCALLSEPEYDALLFLGIDTIVHFNRSAGVYP